ncbi:30S ribosomal protein S21 [Mycoplasma mycoides]|uniref:30S ribosomal protein S21 n=1 Tax=Mycoplasma mycoides TaxID=2102 RepID=UPI00223F792C|nr:30S ribosomal protein S21 [Mycoplasma mycoides]
MASVIVHDGETIEKALKRFQKVASSNKAEARKREYHLSKKEKTYLQTKTKP